MPFEIRFYGDDPQVTLAEVRALLNIGQRVEVGEIKGTPANVPSLAPVGDDPVGRAVGKARARRAAAEPKQVDLEEAIAESVATVEEAPAAEPAKSVSKDELRAKLIELMNTKGEQVPSELLKEKFSVSKIGELDPAQYGACFEAAVAAIAAED